MLVCLQYEENSCELVH